MSLKVLDIRKADEAMCCAKELGYGVQLIMCLTFSRGVGGISGEFLEFRGGSGVVQTCNESHCMILVIQCCVKSHHLGLMGD